MASEHNPVRYPLSEIWPCDHFSHYFSLNKARQKEAPVDPVGLNYFCCLDFVFVLFALIISGCFYYPPPLSTYQKDRFPVFFQWKIEGVILYAGVLSETNVETYVLETKLPLVPCGKGWSSNK